jgi:hypothetical protein
LTNCSGRCVNLAGSDSHNCGACSNQCSGQCVGGQCV